MKQLSVLVALMLIITVGGVYATWTYFNAIKPIDPVEASIRVTLAGTDSTDVAKGIISASVSGDFSLVIDQKEVGGGEATWVTAGKITGTFTPHDNATDDVKASGIPLQFTLSGANLPSGLTISTTTATITGGATEELDH